MARQTKAKSPLQDELGQMREQMARLENELAIQRQIAFAAGIFQADVTVRTLLESLAEGVVICDSDGRIVLINRRAEEIFGYSQDEVVGRPLNLLLPERFFETHRQHLSEFFKDPRIRSMGQGLELAGKRKDGAEFPIEVSLSYLHTEVGLLGLAFVTDITKRKEAERALKLRNEELDAFAHTVAHDLKASLSMLIGYSEVLVETYKTLSEEEVEEYLSALARNGRKMNNIIDELLIFASMGKKAITPGPVDMAVVVNDVLERLQYAIKEYRAEIILPGSFPMALGYAPWLEEVWMNYITNAMKYGGTPPVIRLGSDPLPNGFIKYWVHDNGAGLTPEQQAAVFEPFTRMAGPRIKGYGLGLSIVKRIVERLNGQVGIESEPGQGSTFSFALPAYKTA